MKTMKNFSDVVNKLSGGVDTKKLQKGIKISIPADKAIAVFEEDTVYCEIGRLEVRVKWVRDSEGKVKQADVTLRLLP